MSAIIAPTRFGPMLLPPADMYVGQALIRMGQYAPAEFATWAPYLPEGGVVVDAGANLGAHTMAFAAVVGADGMVLAFEPQRHLHNMLSGSIELCGARNVRAMNVALGRELGAIRIPDLDYDAPQNFGGIAPGPAWDDVPGEMVAVRTIDMHNLTRLDFLKVDVEGAELDVLHGATETISLCRPVLAVEADRQENTPALLAFLRLNGYRVWWHRPPLGPLWPNVISLNVLALPCERAELPEPIGYVEPAVE